MKRSLLPLLLFFLLLNACAPDTGSNIPAAYQSNPDSVCVRGKFTNSKGDTFYLLEPGPQKFIPLDSSITDDSGAFSFDKKIISKGVYLVSDRRMQQFATVILGPGEPVTTITGDAKRLGYTYAVENNAETSDFLEFNAGLMEYQTKLDNMKRYGDSLQQVFTAQMSMHAQDKKLMDSLLDKVYQPLYNKNDTNYRLTQNQAVNFLVTYVRKHIGSFASIPAIRRLQPRNNIGLYDSVLAPLRKKYPTSQDVIALEAIVTSTHAIIPGGTAPEMRMNDPSGVSRSLSALRGKVVLIDFWASWCQPCIAELPKVVAAYKKYKDKGFEIFSVSLDREKGAWTSAITKYNLTWPNHVSELMEWRSSFVSLYDFNGIPFMVLLDKDGKIISRGIRGDELDATLAGLLK